MKKEKKYIQFLPTWYPECDYRGFKIIRSRTLKVFSIKGYEALVVISVEVAKRCIDTYLNHMEFKGMINYE